MNRTHLFTGLFINLMLMLTACGDDSNSSSPTGCQNDQDCKGDRVCSADKTCVDPSNGGTNTTGNTTMTNGMSTNTSETGTSISEGNTDNLNLTVSFEDCLTRCSAKAMSCGASGELLEDICGYELCRDRAISVTEADCLEGKACQELQGVFLGQVNSICGVTLTPKPSNPSTPATKPPSKTPSGGSTCGSVGASCMTGSDCGGWSCFCDGKRQFGDLFTCKPTQQNMGTCPSGSDVCGASCPKGSRVKWEKAGCWGD